MTVLYFDLWLILLIMNDRLPLQLLSLLDEPTITDLIFNGHEQTYADFGSGLEVVPNVVFSEQELADLAIELISLGGRHLDQANPFADVSVSGGLRIHAVLASACSPKTLLSIRVHNQLGFSLDALQQRGMFSVEEKDLLKKIVQDKESFLICGATGSGKTSLLRAMLLECSSERIIAIEDVSEMSGNSIICLQTRQSNIEGRGEISLTRLLREALRMRPDRLAVGEVRGTELMVMLQALNTGHRGAGATMHANSLLEIPARLTSIATASGIKPNELAQLTVSAFQWVIQLQSNLGKRNIEAIGTFGLDKSGQLQVSKVEIEQKDSWARN
jgi:pilus assembly protein CpaF